MNKISHGVGANVCKNLVLIKISVWFLPHSRYNGNKENLMTKLSYTKWNQAAVNNNQLKV